MKLPVFVYHLQLLYFQQFLMQEQEQRENGACNNFIVFKERTYEGRKQFTSMKVAKTYELLMNSNEDSIILQ